YDAIYQPFRRLHVGIPWADDFVDGAYALGAISQRSHGLGAADAKHFLETRDRGSSKHCLALTRFDRRDHYNFFDTGDLRCNRVHQNCRWVSTRAARHIDSDPLKRSNNLAEANAQLVAILERFVEIARMKIADTPRGQLE